MGSIESLDERIRVKTGKPSGTARVLPFPNGTVRALPVPIENTRVSLLAGVAYAIARMTGKADSLEFARILDRVRRTRSPVMEFRFLERLLIGEQGGLQNYTNNRKLRIQIGHAVLLLMPSGQNTEKSYRLRKEIQEAEYPDFFDAKIARIVSDVLLVRDTDISPFLLGGKIIERYVKLGQLESFQDSRAQLVWHALCYTVWSQEFAPRTR